MTMSKSHVALVLLPLLVAACSSETDSSGGEGGAGGGETSTSQAAGGETSATQGAGGEDAGGENAGGENAGGEAASDDGLALGRTGDAPADETADDDVEALTPVRMRVDGRATQSIPSNLDTVSYDLVTDACDLANEQGQKVLVETEVASSYRVQFTDTTVGATDSLDTCWTEPAVDGGERIYYIDLPAAGILSAELFSTAAVGSTFDPALVVRQDCASNDEWCHDGGAKSQKHQSYQTEGRVYLIVDTRGDAGSFELVVTLNPSVCGDGVVGPHEECDMGGAGANDGCSDPGHASYLDDCQLEAPAASSGDSCATRGTAIAIPAGESERTGVQAMTTHGYTDDAIGSCMPATGGGDRVLELVPAATGTLYVAAGMIASASFGDPDNLKSFCAENPGSQWCFDVELYVRSTCDQAASEIACKSDCCDGETLSFPVTQGVPVFLFVDGYDSEWYSQGPFNLHFNLDVAAGEGAGGGAN